jgi:hypothetical protein
VADAERLAKVLKPDIRDGDSHRGLHGRIGAALGSARTLDPRMVDALSCESKPPRSISV